MLQRVILIFFLLFTLQANSAWTSGPGPEVFNIPLTVVTGSGAFASDFPVKGGIPFAQGELRESDLKNLVVVDDQGTQVLSQHQPLAYWWGQDGSVKWLLTDFLADTGTPGASYHLKHRQGQRTTSAEVVTVTWEDEKIIVNTGPLKAVISRTKGTLLEAVYLDMNHDGKFDPEEQVIRLDRENGIHLTSANQEVVFGSCNSFNMWGSGSGRIQQYHNAGRLIEHTYMSGLGKPEKVEVESAGPVRATILVQGRHLPLKQQEGILPKGFYAYTARLSFFSGQSFILLEPAIENNREDFPIHIYEIKDMRLHFSTALDPDADLHYRIGGEKVTQTGQLASERIGIFQDSANLDRWDLHSRLAAATENENGKEKDKVSGNFFQASWRIGPARFRGYRVCANDTGTLSEECIASGDQAPGWATLSDERKGIGVYVNRFWEECPKAIVLGARGVDAVLFPGFSPEEFQIHSGSRKSHTVYLDFSDTNHDRQDRDERASLFRHPPVLKTEGVRYAETLALPRVIGVGKKLTEKESGHWYPHSRWHRNIITARWNTAGLESNFNQGGMHDNYWSIFTDFIANNDVFSYEKGMINAKWASEAIPWLIQDYVLSPGNLDVQDRLIGYGGKEVFTSLKAAGIKGWKDPFKTNIPGFSSPVKFHVDGEHLIHMWPFEWYYLTGSAIAKDGLIALGNQAKYSVHRNFFKNREGSSGQLNPAPSLDQVFYFDDGRYPERIPRYFYTRIYSSHLLSLAMAYGATGDEACLFYARWLVRRMLYLQDKNIGVLGEPRRWKNISPWQESEAAIAAFEFYKETQDEVLLDIMGSWLEWAWHEAYVQGKGMPHRFLRGSSPEASDRLEHHWYPGVAAPLCYAALGDNKALDLTREWANSSLPYIKRGTFTDHPVGQAASYVENYIEKKRIDKIPPEAVSDLSAIYSRKDGRINLTWTAPTDRGKGSRGNSDRYWIKIADLPIVDHPYFKDGSTTSKGFYQADNIEGEPVPGSAGHSETFEISHFAPHEAYGAGKGERLQKFENRTYHLVIRSWDHAGNLSPLSNPVSVRIGE